MAPAFALSHRWPEWLGDGQLGDWKQRGYLSFFHYAEGRERRLGYRIIEDAAQYEDYPDVVQPTLVFHGRADASPVPHTLIRGFRPPAPQRRAHAARRRPRASCLARNHLDGHPPLLRSVSL